ncbi:MAG: DUF2125 domain-containing protein [Oricola sp.]
MVNDKEKQPYNAGRRIRLLAAGIVVAIAAYTAGWYWLAGRVETETARFVASEKDHGTAIDCAGRDVRGYPFRLEVFCTALDVARPGDGLAVRAGAFRSAAQVYDPRRVYAELDSPLAVTGARAGEMRLDWSLARATATIAQPLPERASVAMEDLAVALGSIEKAIVAAHAEAHMRLNGGNLDLAWRYDGLVLGENLTGRSGLPVLAGDADITIENGAALAAAGIRSLRGISGEIHRLALRVTPDEGLLVSGPFSVGADGLVDAKLDVYLVDPAGFAKAFRPAFPEQAAKIDMVAGLPTQAGPDGTPEIRLPVTITGGNAVVGFIPLGRLPALR